MLDCQSERTLSATMEQAARRELALRWRVRLVFGACLAAAGWAHVVIPGSRRSGDLGSHAALNLASRHGLQQSHTHTMRRLVFGVACCMTLPLHGGSKVQSLDEAGVEECVCCFLSLL